MRGSPARRPRIDRQNLRPPRPPTRPWTSTFALHATATGTPYGTVRRNGEDGVIPFHGVRELVTVLDRLLAGASDDGEG